MLAHHEYLVSYGTLGDFGRFRPVSPLTCRRGQRAVVRTHRGLELGVVLCVARPGHARFLPNTTVGPLLRVCTAEDEQAAERLRERGRLLFEDSRQVAARLNLPLEVLDAEVLLDGEQAVLHHVRWGDFDERELVSRLSREHDVRIALHNLTLPAAADEEHEHGCGRPDCGRGEGGCSTCGSGGGCSSCGSAKPDDVRAYFAGLREQMAARQRMPLL